MKDAEGQEIIPGDLYRNRECIALDFDPSISKLYLVRQLPAGLLVAKDSFGVYRKVRSQQEPVETYNDQSRAVFERVYASQLYHCSEQDILCLQEKLTRTQERTPKLLSLLNSTQSQNHFRQSLEDASERVSKWPAWMQNALGAPSQPKCTGTQREPESDHEIDMGQTRRGIDESERSSARDITRRASTLIQEL